MGGGSSKINSFPFRSFSRSFHSETLSVKLTLLLYVARFVTCRSTFRLAACRFIIKLKAEVLMLVLRLLRFILWVLPVIHISS
jgi:hypothetical protein